ncbi:MAG: NADH-quinone oxidoreductase subunit M [Alphaproteobacteria bacterium]|nr:NADH-quinone oxidoreductase subunit M [Alphaproteobacteria bacterium]
MTLVEENILTIITFLPLAVGLLCFLVSDKAAWSVALGGSIVTMLASWTLWGAYDPGGEAFQLTQTVAWIPDMGIHYAVGIDGISLLLILLTTLLTPVIILSASPAIHDRLNQYLGWMMVLETAMLGTFVALDTFLFYVFWELMLIPMYFIIGMWGGERRIYATIKFFIYTMLGSLLMLVAILALYVTYAEQTGSYSALLVDLYNTDLTYSTQLWMFAAFALAFAIKVPMFPVHTWLPDAHFEAPTGGSVVLAGVLLKMGTYGFVRFAMPLFPDAAVALAPAIVTLAVIGIIYGALVAMVQDDIKKLVAYSSVSHMGYVMLGLFALNAVGITGAVYQMLGHGLATGALFLLVGILYERRHTKVIAEFGGLSKVVPVFAFVFMVVTFASVGLPGLNGFIGEFLILLGSFERAPVATVFAASGVILGAVYMLWMFQRVMFGPLTNASNKSMQDLTGRELAYLAPILVLIVVMGVYPGPFLDVMQPSVERLVDVLGQSNLSEATVALDVPHGAGAAVEAASSAGSH